MVHTRLNQSGANPNPHINFITALPTTNVASQEDARELLCALAAQARPVMKAHGFSVNSLDEYEHNSVFLGRNWNNGETIELVLRRRDGLFLPTSSLMGTFCHELAHIKHMDHGVAFQALWEELRSDIRKLQNKGYYGDGCWSAGTRLADGATVAGAGIQPGDFPKYMCGGAQSRSRQTALRRRKRREPGPSLHTGAQSSKKRKAGARVTNANLFTGVGTALNSGDAENTKGVGFGKRAASKHAREERALAAERRIRALKVQAQREPTSSATIMDDLKSDSDAESDSESEAVQETDQDRLRILMDTLGDGNIDDLKESWIVFDNDFDFDVKASITVSGSASSSTRNQKDETNAMGCEFPQSSSSESMFAATAPARSLIHARTSDGKGKEIATDANTHLPPESTRKVSNPSSKPGLGLGRLAQTEIDHRKKESLGLLPTHSTRKIGAGVTLRRSSGSARHNDSRGGDEQGVTDVGETLGSQWSCLVCTLSNDADHLACSACATPRGESVWARDQPNIPL